MRKLILVSGLIVVFGSSLLVAGARIFTNPNPDALLKKIFPNAVAFSPLAGNPLHYTAYAADPAKNPNAEELGYAFWTTDMVPAEHGYHGAIHLLVGLTKTGVINGVIMDYHSEPYGYFSVEPKEFVEQFRNKSIRDPFRVGQDVDAVSRATLTINSATRAIRDGSRMMARAFLNPDAVKR